MRVKNEGLELT
jgi:hypothetical protein